MLGSPFSPLGPYNALGQVLQGVPPRCLQQRQVYTNAEIAAQQAAHAREFHKAFMERAKRPRKCTLCGFIHEPENCRPSALHADHLPYETA